MPLSEKLQDKLAYPPRGMRADRAAAYLGMSQSKFLELVERELMPKPTRIDGMTIWDRLALDLAFENMSEEQERVSVNTADLAMGLNKK